MTYFNTVLLPPPPLCAALTDHARERFSGWAEGYCLSENVWPHITLCQFQTEPARAAAIRDDFGRRFPAPDIAPVLGPPAVRQGMGRHAGFVWLELPVKKSDWLLKRQGEVHAALAEYGVKILAPGGDRYHPHITLCRLKAAATVKMFDAPEESIVAGQGGAWTFTCGRSDENGQFLGEMT